MRSQLVVMAGGLNDFVLSEPPVLEDWRSRYLEFLQQVCMSTCWNMYMMELLDASCLHAVPSL